MILFDVHIYPSWHQENLCQCGWPHISISKMAGVWIQNYVKYCIFIINFLSARSSHSKSKLIHGCIQQWCHSNKISKRLDQSFGYTCWNPNPIHMFAWFTFSVNILCFQVWNDLFVEIFLSYDFITIVYRWHPYIQFLKNMKICVCRYLTYIPVAVYLKYVILTLHYDIAMASAGFHATEVLRGC